MNRFVIVVMVVALAAGAGMAHAQPGRADGGPSSAAASAERRVALVIGNGAYPQAPLDNPVNDARAMARALEAAGFGVLLRENLDLRGMVEAVRLFGDRLDANGVALFYYAGHGVQVKDRNYLIPVDADLRREDEVIFLSIDAGQVLEKMDRAGSRVNLMVLDACRDNPFARASRSIAKGLAAMDAPAGTLIAYATAPGKVALDGIGRSVHSVYTKHLLENLLTPDLAVELMFKRVRESVARETRNAQTPWENTSLRGDFYFVPQQAAAQSAAGAQATGARPGALSEAVTVELAFWDSVRSSAAPADYEAYLRQYPEGRFAPLARARVEALSREPVAAPAAAQPVTPGIAPARVDAPPASGAAIVTAPRKPAVAAEDARPPAQPAVARAEPTAASSRRAPIAVAFEAQLPKAGDEWVYRQTEGFGGMGGTELVYRVRELSAAGVVEALSIPRRAGFAEERAIEPGIGLNAWRGIGFSTPDLAPYAQASFDLAKTPALPSVRRRIGPDVDVVLELRAVGTERITVPAGTFNAVKVVAEGFGSPPFARLDQRHHVRYQLWYAPEVKRTVRYEVRHYIGIQPSELLTYDLVRYQVQ